MSFFKNSLRALGFGKDDDNDERTFTAKDIVNVTGNNQVASDKNTPAIDTATTATDDSNSNSTLLPHALLDKVVQLINASFPEFVRNYIDIESEKKYIYEQLGDSFKEYINELNQSALSQSQANVASARKKLETEMETLRRKTAELEEQKVESKNAQLSAERQKRALSEKVHELDNRIATLEAEKEQYDLENKSLINKLKVSGVKQQELDDAQEEINRLLGVVQELKKNAVVPEETQSELNEKNAAIEALQERITYLTTEKDELAASIASLNTERQSLQSTIDEKETIIARLTDEIATMVTQQDNSTREIAELNSAKEVATSLQAALDEARIQHTTLTEQMVALTAEKNHSIELLQQQLATAQASLDSTTAQLAATTEQLSNSEQQALQNNTSFNDKIEDLALQLNVATNNYTQAAEQLEATIEENNTLQEHIKQLQQQVALLTEASNAQQATESTLQALRDETAGMQEQLAQYREENTTLQSQVAQYKEDNTAYQSRIDELTQATQQLTDEATRKQALEQELSASHAQINALHNQASSLQEETASLQEQLRETQEQLRQAQEGLRESQDNLKLSQENLKETREHLTATQEQLTTTQEQLDEAREQAQKASAHSTSSNVDAQELERANNMIAALKKQRQDLVSQTATLRSQNKAYENQIAILESKLNSADNNDSDTYESVTDLDDALNWMMPIVPDTLEEEARRREEEERQRREEEERERQAEKERQATRDNSAQMSLW